MAEGLSITEMMSVWPWNVNRRLVGCSTKAIHQWMMDGCEWSEFLSTHGHSDVHIIQIIDTDYTLTCQQAGLTPAGRRPSVADAVPSSIRRLDHLIRWLRDWHSLTTVILSVPYEETWPGSPATTRALSGNMIFMWGLGQVWQRREIHPAYFISGY